MNSTEIPAPPPLDEIVRCFWFRRGALTQQAPQVIVPDGRREIVLQLAEPFALVATSGVARRCDADACRQPDIRRCAAARYLRTKPLVAIQSLIAANARSA